jgi:2-polyprenyl-3-methyl-5-hydroxy-6-metoxy-1,4-benzoquinol methylase
MNTDFFAGAAASYDQDGHRVGNVDNIARAMITAVQFEQSMRLMDFGSGTGLLLERIGSLVGEITAADAGFSDIEVTTASIARKPHGDFPVFLLTARR